MLNKGFSIFASIVTFVIALIVIHVTRIDIPRAIRESCGDGPNENWYNYNRDTEDNGNDFGSYCAENEDADVEY
jgi:hypothetical protein